MRGLIYFVKMPEHTTAAKHSCEWGYRPVVIVSSEVGNRTSNIVMACPITTRIKSLSCNVNISWNIDGRQSQVLCNQIITLPKSECKLCRGGLTAEEMCNVENAMLISLGMRTRYEEAK